MGKSILTKEQAKFLEFVLESPKITNQFYLTGGTALSEYYFQHRLSEDFDFFSQEKLDDNFLLSWVKKAANALKIEDIELKTLHGQNTFFFHFPHSVVKVDFAHYPFEALGEMKKVGKLKVSSVLDITVNKFQALQSRHRGRDFFDLFVILNSKEQNLDLDVLMKNYRNKFGVGISRQEVAKNFLKIVDAIDQPRFLGKVNWQEVEDFFLEEVKKLGEQVIA